MQYALQVRQIRLISQNKVVATNVSVKLLLPPQLQLKHADTLLTLDDHNNSNNNSTTSTTSSSNSKGDKKKKSKKSSSSSSKDNKSSLKLELGNVTETTDLSVQFGMNPKVHAIHSLRCGYNQYTKLYITMNNNNNNIDEQQEEGN